MRYNNPYKCLGDIDLLAVVNTARYLYRGLGSLYVNAITY